MPLCDVSHPDDDVPFVPHPELDGVAWSEAIGYQVPAPFIARWNRIVAAANATGFADISGDFLGFELGSRPRRYDRTPFEMSPFGWTGVGGTHYGHVRYVERPASEDHPVACFCPADSGVGAYRVGGSSREALDNLLARQYEWALDNHEDEWVARHQALFASLGFEPSGHGTDQMYTPAGGGRPNAPATIPGWWHLPASDGVGVFAPSAAFHALDTRAFPIGAPSSPEAARDLARSFIGRHPASALFHLKELWFAGERDVAVSALLQTCYRALGRDDLAAVVASSQQGAV